MGVNVAFNEEDASFQFNCPSRFTLCANCALMSRFELILRVLKLVTIVFKLISEVSMISILKSHINTYVGSSMKSITF